MLEVTNLAKSYPTPRGPLEILSDLSLSLQPGDAASIVGPSGSGKSTLLYVLGALEPPTSGTVTVDGVDPFTLSPAELATFRNRRVGFVFQDHLLLPQCTVLENVLIPTLVGDGRRMMRRPGRGICSNGSGWPTGSTIVRRSCLAASDSVYRWRGRSSISPRCCCVTNQPATSTTPPAMWSRRCCSSCTSGRDTVLVVVTHNTALAAKCPIRFELVGQRLERAETE